MPALIHNAVIIGGGPAGSAVAITLARHNIPVCLLERKTGPHDKVCGEFISWEAAQYLQSLGIDLPALGAQPIQRFKLYSGEQMLTTALPFTGWSLSRRRLDDALLRAAKVAGATVQTGAAVRKLQREEEAWNLSINRSCDKSLVGNKNKEPLAQQDWEEAHELSTETLRARTVFLASGKHDLRCWSRVKQSDNPGDVVGFKMHLTLTPVQQELMRGIVEIHLFDGGYAGLESVEDHKTNLCFLINKRIFLACNRSWPNLLDWLGRTSSHMQQRLSGAVPLWQQPLAISGVPYGYLHSPSLAEPDLFRLGDQAAVIPSFAGDGIAMALHSGILAARIYTENTCTENTCAENTCATDGAAGGNALAYHRQAMQDFQRQVRNAQRLEKMFSSRAGRKAALLLGRACPRLVTTAMMHTRIHPSLFL